MKKYLATLISVTAFCMVLSPAFAQQNGDAENPAKEPAESSGDELVEVKPDSADEESAAEEKTAEQKTVSETGKTDKASEAEQKQLINLSFKNADLKDVLRSLAAMRPDSTIMIDPDVEGTASFELQNFEWRAALDLIAKTHQLAVSKEGDDVYIVRPAGEVTDTMSQAEQRRPEEGAEEGEDEDQGERKIFRSEGMVIEFYSSEEIKNLSEKKLLKLYAIAFGERQQEEGDVDVAKTRKALLASPKKYIKRITVNNRNAVQVVKQLLQNADLDYSFSGGLTQQQQQSSAEKESEKSSTNVPVSRVSLQFRNTTVPEALRNVCRQGNISCEKSGNVWKIKPMKTDKAPLNLHTFEIRYIPLNEGLVKLLGSFIERGTVKSGESKTLVANVTDSGAEKIRKILDAVDLPTKQVLIEARFFELTDDFEKNLGIDWKDLGSTDGAQFSLEPNDMIWDYEDPSAVDKVFYERDAELNDAYRDELVSGNNPPEEWFDPAIEPRTALLSMPEFSVVLHALQKDSGAKQLSNPKVIVSSGEDAMIHIGKQEPILKSQTETTDAGTVTTFQLDENFETEELSGYLDLGTRLKVTPTVKTKNKVYVSVTPRLTSIVGEKTAGNTSYPILFTTRVNTQYTMPSGKTIAIGGLVKERDRDSIQKVPFLGDIPMLGRLFSYHQKTTEKSETIVFLTVKVMEGDELKTTAGIPIRGRLVQEEVERIRKEDAAGAEYDYDRLKKKLEEELDIEESDKSQEQETEAADKASDDTEKATEVESEEAVTVEEEEVTVEEKEVKSTEDTEKGDTDTESGEKGDATAEEAESVAKKEETATKETEGTDAEAGEKGEASESATSSEKEKAGLDEEEEITEIEKEITAIESEMERIEENFEEEETDTEKSDENSGEEKASETTVDENSAENE